MLYGMSTPRKSLTSFFESVPSPFKASLVRPLCFRVRRTSAWSCLKHGNSQAAASGEQFGCTIGSHRTYGRPVPTELDHCVPRGLRFTVEDGMCGDVASFLVAEYL